MNNVIKNGLQEGEEEFAEYTLNSFADVVADSIFSGEVSFDFSLIDAFNQALTGAIIGGSFGAAEGLSGMNRTVNKLIKNDMNDTKRYDILKNAYINIPFDSKSLMFENKVSEIADFPPRAKSRIEKKIRTVAEEAGVFDKDFKVDGIDFSFKMGKNNGFTKSMNNQTKYQGSYADLTKVLLNLENIIPNSILIESHANDIYKGTGREDTNFEQGCTLLGAFRDEEYITPVKMTIKKDKGQTGNLYVVVAMDKIKRTGVLGRGVTSNDGLQTLPATDSVYSLSRIVSGVNARDSQFLKHVPDRMLSFEQMLSKNKAIIQENERLEKAKTEKKEEKLRK